MRAVPYLLTLTAALAACAHRTAAVQTTPGQPVAGPTNPRLRPRMTIPINTFPNDTVLVFQRTPCYGTCPSYTATIFRSGKVAYHGDRFVPLLGDHAFSLDPAAVTAMLEQARAINFNGLAHSYKGNTSDLPATVITVYQPGQPRYRVYAEEGIPTPLQGYIAYLRGKLDPLAGLGVDR